MIIFLVRLQNVKRMEGEYPELMCLIEVPRALHDDIFQTRYFFGPGWNVQPIQRCERSGEPLFQFAGLQVAENVTPLRSSWPYLFVKG